VYTKIKIEKLFCRPHFKCTWLLVYKN